MEDYLRQYTLIVIFTGVALIVPTSMIVISRLFQALRIRPRKPTGVKLDTYECGMEPIGGHWGQFNFRYYMYALLFVIFDVEAVFIYPWAVKFNQLGLFALVEMFVFIGILVVGWLYAWRKKDLEWR